MGSSKDRNSLRSRQSVNSAANDKAQTQDQPSQQQPTQNQPTNRRKSLFPAENGDFNPNRRKSLAANLAGDTISLRSAQSRNGRRRKTSRGLRNKAPSSSTGSRPPTLVSEILKKRTQYQKYDPTLTADECAIALLVSNEKQKGRLPNREQDKVVLDEKRARALRNWEYLRHVTKAIGANRRGLVRAQQRRLRQEMEERRRELEEAEKAMMQNEEKLVLQADDEETEPENLVEEELEGQIEEINEAESIDYNPYEEDIFEDRKLKSFNLQLPVPPEFLTAVVQPTRSFSNFHKNARNLFNEQMTTTCLASTEKFGGETWDLNKLEASLSDVTKTWVKNGEEQHKYLEEDCMITGESADNLESSPTKMDSEGIISHSSETVNTTAVRKRAIFAAPSWDPDNPESLARVHSMLKKMPVVYYGEEKAVDVPDEYNKDAVAMVTGTGELSSKKNDNDVSGSRRLFAFRAPAKVRIQDQEAGHSEGNSDENIPNKTTDEKDEDQVREGEGEPFDAEAAQAKEEAEQANAAVGNFDLAEEYARRREYIEKKKEQLLKLEQKAIRFTSDSEVKISENRRPREFLHGYSVLPEHYTGKIVINVIYGNNALIPPEARLPNPKNQLYVSVTHLFDFSRFEILNKKKPRVAFLLRPLDKAFPYPKGANKYREVELNRKTGDVSGETSSMTFDISPSTVEKRWLFIRVKAFKGMVPSDFLGQIKVDFAEYERVQDICIVDKEAYLYGKFNTIGTLDVEMYYKVQQGCLTITLHSANIFPSSENPGDTSVKIYHKYMGRLVEKMRSALQRETFMPVYEETFTFKLPKGMIEESILQFKLMSKPAVTFVSDSILGEVNLAQRTNCDQWKDFFVEALMSPNPKPIRATLPLMYYK